MLYAEDTCTLKVKITNFRSANNNVILLLFDDKNTSKFSDSKYSIKKIESKVKNNALVLSIPNLKYGKYAIAVLHDEDNNGDGYENDELNIAKKIDDAEKSRRGIG